MADIRSKLAEALTNYVEMPGRQISQLWKTTPQKLGGALKKEGSNILESIKSAYNAPSRAWQGDFAPKTYMDENGRIVTDDSEAAQQAMNFAMNFMGSSSLPALNNPMQHGSLGITAWHGSPATFNKFDMSKIGDSTGSQLFGHGLYFTESPKYAETFKAPSKGAEATAFDYLKKYGTKEQALNALNDMKEASFTELGKSHLQNAYDLIKSGNVGEGNLYKVDIADESIPKMLEWDKPLFEQNEYVKNAINNLGDKFRPLDELEAKNVTGERLYRRIENSLGQNFGEAANPMASKMLKNAGIHGIKYSNSANNYVVFDPELVKILQRNGIDLP